MLVDFARLWNADSLIFSPNLFQRAAAQPLRHSRIDGRLVIPSRRVQYYYHLPRLPAFFKFFARVLESSELLWMSQIPIRIQTDKRIQIWKPIHASCSSGKTPLRALTIQQRQENATRKSGLGKTVFGPTLKCSYKPLWKLKLCLCLFPQLEPKSLVNHVSSSCSRGPWTFFKFFFFGVQFCYRHPVLAWNRNASHHRILAAIAAPAAFHRVRYVASCADFFPFKLKRTVLIYLKVSLPRVFPLLDDFLTPPPRRRLHAFPSLMNQPFKKLFIIGRLL